jgi:hypothetical protein
LKFIAFNSCSSPAIDTTRATLIAALLASFAAPAAALDASFGDFSNVSSLQLNDRAATIGNAVTDDQGRKVLRLTDNYAQKGSAYLPTAVSLANDLSFSTSFQFRITAGDGFHESGEFPVKGADGITFVVGSTYNVTGAAGDGIGYHGNWYSAAIEFDTFDNGAPRDVDGNHVGVNLSGSANSVTARRVTEGLLNNGQVWSAWIDYDGVADRIEVRVTQGAGAARPDEAFLAYDTDLDSIVLGNDVYFGFTSATGSLRNNHDILNWNIRTIAAVPEPEPFALLGLGSLVVVLQARRRRIEAGEETSAG